MQARLVKFYDFVCFVTNRFIEDRGTQNAGALTYTTLFAVVPMLTVVFVMLAGIPAFQGVGEQIQEFIFKSFVPSTGDKVHEYLQGFISQARQLTWVGVVFLIITTFMMLITVEQSFNSIWRVQKPRRGLSRFLLYWALLSLGPLLLGAGFAVSTYIMSLSFMSGSDTISNVLRYIPLVASILGFTLVYAAIPNIRVPIKHAFISGLFATLLLDFARSIFGFYVKTFPSYQLIYGAFAAVPLFLLWIYVSWVIVLVGCEISCCLGLRRYIYRKNVPELFVALATLKVFYERQLQGKVVSYLNVREAGWPLPEDEWVKLLDFFKSEKLICDIDGSHWALCRDMHQYSFQRFLAYSPWPTPRVDQIPDELLNEAWFINIRGALLEFEQAKSVIFEGSLASWLTPAALESDAVLTGSEFDIKDPQATL